MENLKKIRVCICMGQVTGLFFPSQSMKIGGAEVQMYTYGKALAESPVFDVHFLTNVEKVESSTTVGKVTVHFTRFQAGLRKGRGFQEALREIDADVWITKVWGWIPAELYWYCRRNGKQFIYWCAHDREVQSVEGLPLFHDRRLRSRAITSADLIIAQTGYQQACLRDIHGRESVLVHNALDVEPLEDAEKKQDYILWIGRMAEVKRPDLLLDLAEALPEIPFRMVAVIAKEDQRRVYEKYRKRIERLDNVEFIPGVPFEESQDLYEKARMLVSTSDSEGFSNTFIQAMYARTPIASFQVDPDGIIAEHGLGVAPPADGSFDTFREELLKLYGDEERLTACGRRGQDYALEHCNIERNAERLSELVQALVREGGRKRKGLFGTRWWTLSRLHVLLLFLVVCRRPKTGIVAKIRKILRVSKEVQ